jgi:hypothetical protein
MSDGAWAGVDAENMATAFLRKLRIAARMSWELPLSIQVTLEDGSETVVEVEWKPDQSPNLRRMVGQRLAQLSETLPHPQCVEPHRFLELVEGRSLRYLRDRRTPNYLRTALREIHSPLPLQATKTQPCARCGLAVGHEFPWGIPSRAHEPGRAHRHFLEDGSICLTTVGSCPTRERASLVREGPQSEAHKPTYGLSLSNTSPQSEIQS